MPRLTLADLIAPCTSTRFFRTYWAKKPLVLLRNNSAICDGLPTIDDYDFLVGSLAAPADGWFSLVKGRAERPPSSTLTRDGTLNLAEIYEAVGRGHSLLLTKLHKRERSIGNLCREIETALSGHGVQLSRPVGANGYFTPRSAQGFATHYDDHDVLILQLAGSKNWRIYRRTVDSPLEPPERPLTAREAGKPVQEFTLARGDLIYMPRGFAHEACTSGDMSLHLTLSLYPATWRDLFGRILATDARFRRNLPIGFAQEGALTGADRRRLRKLGGLLAESPAASAAATRIANQLLDESDLPASTGLQEVAEAAPLTATSRVRLADGVRSSVGVNGASATLYLPGTNLRADRALERAFRRIARGTEFRVRDLPVATDAASKLKLVEDLLRSGFLTRGTARLQNRDE